MRASVSRRMCAVVLALGAPAAAAQPPDADFHRLVSEALR